MSSSVTVAAPAKINLQLGVGAARADGFHTLATVYQAIGLYDEVTVTPAESTTLTVVGEGVDVSDVPTDSGNLALRAAALLAKHAGLEGVRIHDLRHSFVSLLFAEGRTVIEVARQDGPDWFSRILEAEQDGRLDPQSRADPYLGALDRGQPAGPYRETAERFPGQVVVPLATVLSVDALPVHGGQAERDDAVRRGVAQPGDGGHDRPADQPGRVEVEERAVQEEAVDDALVVARV